MDAPPRDVESGNDFSAGLIGRVPRALHPSNSILSRSPSLHVSYMEAAALTLTRASTDTDKAAEARRHTITESHEPEDPADTTPLLSAPPRPIHTPHHPPSGPTTNGTANELVIPTTPSNLTGKALQRKLDFAYNVSWVVNIFLFVAKGYAYKLSGSSAVLASLADSGVDLVSQVVIFLAEHQSKKSSPAYPVGQARLETIGVLACACVMSVCSFEVIRDGANALYSGFHGHLPFLDTSLIMFTVLGVATALKLLCYVICAALQSKSDSMTALAEDHLNDIMSNMGAIVTAGIAGQFRKVWWLDPVGGIGISAYIVVRWADIAKSQVEKVVGKAAPPEFIQQLNEIIDTHHDNMSVDVIRAYHSGSRFLVEVEVVMPAQMTLKDVHDVSLELQTKLELLDEVERAFVHVDYEFRAEPEHKMERRLMGLEPLTGSPPQATSPLSGQLASQLSGQHSV